MRFTCILIGILCLLCLFNHGNTTLDAQQITSIQIEVSDLDPNWRPEVNNSLTFEIRVTVPSNFGSGTLVAELLNVTTYRGESGNMYSIFEQYGDSDDLGFFANTGWTKPDDNNKRKLSYNISETGTVSLTVLCRDSAAYGELQLTASGSGYTSNTVVIKIPKDDNGNKIADGWQNDDTMNYGQDDDNDSGPNSKVGDGIIVFTEYRGLYVNGNWISTDPNAWDVFVLSDPDLGIGDAYNLPMTVHNMLSTEASRIDGQVYDYKIESQQDVFAIRLMKDTSDLTTSTDGLPCGNVIASGCMRGGPPDSTTQGVIYTKVIEGGINFAVQVLGKSVSVADLTNAVIAHEIGHGVNLEHCPDIDCPNCYMWANSDWPAAYITQFAAHHNSDYDLVPDDGNDSRQPEYGGTVLDRMYNYDRGVYIRQIEDVNGDSVIDIVDLLVVARYLGTNLDPDESYPMDVNNDKSIDISDIIQIANEFGTAREFPHLPEDLNDDRVVNILDLTMVASNLGESGTHAADVNCDGTVDILDLVRVAAAFGYTVAP